MISVKLYFKYTRMILYYRSLVAQHYLICPTVGGCQPCFKTCVSQVIKRVSYFLANNWSKMNGREGGRGGPGGGGVNNKEEVIMLT